jgi:hypothetical protein
VVFAAILIIIFFILYFGIIYCCKKKESIKPINDADRPVSSLTRKTKSSIRSKMSGTPIPSKIEPKIKSFSKPNCFCFPKNVIEPEGNIELKNRTPVPSKQIDETIPPIDKTIRKFWPNSCFENKAKNNDNVLNNKFDDFDYLDNPFVIQVSNVSDNENEKLKILEKCKSFGEITEHCFDSGYLFVSYRNIGDALKLVKNESLAISDDFLTFFKKKVHLIRTKSGSLHRKIKVIISKDKYDINRHHERLVERLIETSEKRIETLDYSCDSKIIEIIVISEKAEFDIIKIRKRWKKLKKLWPEVISVERVEMCDSVYVEYAENEIDFSDLCSFFIIRAEK